MPAGGSPRGSRRPRGRGGLVRRNGHENYERLRGTRQGARSASDARAGSGVGAAGRDRLASGRAGSGAGAAGRDRLASGRASGRNLAPDRRKSRAKEGGRPRVRHILLLAIILSAVALVALLGVLVLSTTPAFTVARVEAEATDHLGEDAIVRLAAVPEGTTLLNLDEDAITANLQKNPWVDSATYVREFPDRLRIQVHEIQVGAVVVMGTGNIAWLIGSDGHWIEPYPLDVPEGQSVNDVALVKAHDMGVLLVTDAPGTVSPVAGNDATDDVIKAVEVYQETFTDELKSQIVSYSAPSEDSLSCTLSSGVQVSLGSAINVEAKQTALQEILSQNSDKLTYVNVRDPESPSYRAVSSDHVRAGTGALGAAG